MVAICSSGTIMSVPATDDRQMFDVGGVDTILGREAHGDVARLTHRIHPVADFHAGERHAQCLRGVVHRNAELVGETAIELDAQFVLGILLGEAHVDGARDLRAPSP